jgi:hypothetical protein
MEDAMNLPRDPNEIEPRGVDPTMQDPVVGETNSTAERNEIRRAEDTWGLMPRASRVGHHHRSGRHAVRRRRAHGNAGSHNVHRCADTGFNTENNADAAAVTHDPF